jgi:hypothetical protein
MVYWNRFISYIYRYHGATRCENSGFAKVARAGKIGRLTVGIKDGMNRQEELYGVYLYIEKNARSERDNSPTVMMPEIMLVGQIKVCCGHGESNFTFQWDNVKNTRRPITSFAGIIVKRLEDNPLLREDSYGRDIFCSSWTDSLIDYTRLYEYEAGKSVRTEPGLVQKESWTERTEPGPMQKESWTERTEPGLVQKESWTERTEPDFPQKDTMTEQAQETESEIASGQDSWGLHAVEPESEEDQYLSLFLQSESLPPFPGSCMGEDESVLEAVKITPNDIGLLDMRNWRLGVNSFLTHGYYNYKYLMLGRVRIRQNVPEYVLGVPGIYSAREKYLAEIFGFDRFIPEKICDVKTGKFGYWIVDIK